MPLIVLAGLLLFVTTTTDAQPAARRRALLIGINDYTASRLGGQQHLPPAPGRDWPNLQGAVNDVEILREMLVLLHGFDARDVVTLTDQQATRGAILESLERHLVQPAAHGDVLFFYFAGHGSRVRNSLSAEPDKLDESLVPADSRIGALDIRDKELRRSFNRILDRGAQLTILLDNCHSGSGARGLPTGARPRGINPDLRDVRDAARNPERRGALVLSAAQDFDRAWETRDAEGKFHGAFSWAWIRAMRDSAADEAAVDTFLRAQARLRGETPFQEPVIEGDVSARLDGFLGARVDRRGDRTVVAVERVRRDGAVVLNGGWANGLSIGSELRVPNDPRSTARLVITAMTGVGRSEARLMTSGRMPEAIRAGALLEVAGWAAPPGRPLRVWMPRVSGSADAIAATAQSIASAAAKRGLRWVRDPIESQPAHVLRRGAGEWELLDADGRIEPAGDDAVAAVSRLDAGSSLFVQLPAPAAIAVDLIRNGIESTANAADADYILVGRYVAGRLSYAWMRPSVRSTDRGKSALPLRTAWIEDLRDDALRDAALRLEKIHAWHLLESPPAARSPYALALRRARDAELVNEPVLIGDEQYELVLRAARPLPRRISQRYVYVFVIDSHGRSTLLFPRRGSVENRFPDTLPPPELIPLGAAGTFEAAPPYGLDTYFLLTTDEALPNPWVLEWEGVRNAARPATTALEQLLLLTSTASRTAGLLTPSNWSLEKAVYESVAPQSLHVRVSTGGGW